MDKPLPVPVSSHAAQVLRDAIALTKPRVISLLLLTTLTSMFITPAGLPSVGLVLATMIGGYLMAGGANAVNMAFDADIDKVMGRTVLRPVPSGRVSARTAYGYGLVLMTLSVLVHLVFVNAVAAALAVVGFFYYTVIYTMWLKRRTVQNIVIGGGAGAMPPMIGYAAASGMIDLTAVLLFVLIFLWTPAHFWALALVKKTEYAKAKVPMLPVVVGEQETLRQMWIYTLVTVAFSFVFVLTGSMGWIYGVIAAIAGVWFTLRVRGLRANYDNKRAFKLYMASMSYLALMFIAMAADRVLL